jgi:hypothetical protein
MATQLREQFVLLSLLPWSVIEEKLENGYGVQPENRSEFVEYLNSSAIARQGSYSHLGEKNTEDADEPRPVKPPKLLGKGISQQKISPEGVLAIRAAKSGVGVVTALAATYGVCKSTIYDVRAGRKRKKEALL